jgi:sec-independent protein translocase protein TatB
MFDVGFDEMLVIAVVAILVIGPKDLPLALRNVGRWVAKVRSVSGHFRSGIETMIREAELEEMEKKWRAQNEAILNAHPHPPVEAASAEAGLPPPASKPEALALQAESAQAQGEPEPQLPLPPP